MEKYAKPQMDVIEFEAEDVITTSCNLVDCDFFDTPSCYEDGCMLFDIPPGVIG